MSKSANASGVLRLGLFRRARQSTVGYPRGFWLLFWGMLINSAGVSIYWPFMTIYMRQRLAVPLTTITLLFTVNSLAGMLSSFVAGPAVDRFGRKGAMVLGLTVSGLAIATMSVAGTLRVWAVVMVLNGAFNLLYRVGADAMVADLIEPERRTGAYALLRMVANLGVAIGPSVGGFVAARSYALAFCIAAGAQVLFALLILLFMGETMPQRNDVLDQPRGDGGYARLLRDRPFLTFCGVYVLAAMAYSLVMVLLPVYAKENFRVSERQSGFIMATNATMVVLFQYGITQVVRRHHHAPVLAVGALFYALGVGSVAWGWSFPTFVASMAVLTIGEMILVPTSTTLTANLAPPDMRGRYMSVFNLTWWVGFGLGPVMGGLLNDRVAPVAIWYGGMAMALAGALGFAALGRWLPDARPRSGQPSTS
jgi:MFS family permease